MFLCLLAFLLLATPSFSAPADDTRLAEAAMKRDAAAVRTLVQQKVDVNALGKDGTPALHWIVRVDDLDTAKLLIAAGADVKLADRYGVTPLQLACANGNAAMIKLLLDAGADANSVDPTAITALMTAAEVGNLESVRALLERGAKVDAREPGYQQTALMFAVRENHPDVVKLLVDHGATSMLGPASARRPNGSSRIPTQRSVTAWAFFAAVCLNVVRESRFRAG